MKTLRSIVITGASSGIGKSCAHYFDHLGYQVIATVRKTEDKLALCASASKRLEAVIMDLTDTVSMQKAAAKIQNIVGKRGLSGLVNNAGIVVSGPMEFLEIDSLRKQMEVNVIGQVAVTQQLLPLLRTGKGRIINIGSISGKFTTPFVGSYAASKHAMEAVTDAMRLELSQWGIPVSIIQPGSVETSIWDKTIAEATGAVKNLSRKAKGLYGTMIKKIEHLAVNRGNKGLDPIKIAKKVQHALESPRPRPRYLIGNDAKLRVFLKNLLPTRWLDRLIMSRIHSAQVPSGFNLKTAAVTLLLMLQIVTGFAKTNLQNADDSYQRRSQGAKESHASNMMIDQAIFYYKQASKYPSNEPAASVGLLRSYYFKATFTAISKNERKELHDRAKSLGEKQVKKFPKSAALKYWLAVNLGKWAQLNGILASARMGIADKMRTLCKDVIRLDPNYNNGGAYMVLSLVHHYTPRIPFILGWPSKNESQKNCAKAIQIAPNDLSNLFCKAMLLEEGGKSAEASAILHKITQSTPCKTKLFEDRAAISKAKELLDDLS